MANISRTLSKFASGFAGGFVTGGWAGGITGGTAAAVTGGKNKPLKSAAIGAGAGFVGGYTAQKVGLQGNTASIGGYDYKPLSSRFNDWLGGPSTPSAPSSSLAVPTLPKLTDLLGPGTNPGVPSPTLDMGQGGGSGSWFPSAADYQAGADAQAGGGGWLPVAIAAGLVLLVGGA